MPHTGYSFLDISLDAIFIVKWIFYYCCSVFLLDISNLYSCCFYPILFIFLFISRWVYNGKGLYLTLYFHIIFIFLDKKDFLLYAMQILFRVFIYVYFIL